MNPKGVIQIAVEPDQSDPYLLDERKYIHKLRGGSTVAESNASLQKLRSAVNVPVIKAFLTAEELMPGDERHTHR